MSKIIASSARSQDLADLIAILHTCFEPDDEPDPALSERRYVMDSLSIVVHQGHSPNGGQWALGWDPDIWEVDGVHLAFFIQGILAGMTMTGVPRGSIKCMLSPLGIELPRGGPCR